LPVSSEAAVVRCDLLWILAECHNCCDAYVRISFGGEERTSGGQSRQLSVIMTRVALRLVHRPDQAPATSCSGYSVHPILICVCVINWWHVISIDKNHRCVFMCMMTLVWMWLVCWGSRTVLSVW